MTTIHLTDVRLIFRNFQGAGGVFNNEGDRNTCVLLSDEQVEVCEQAGLRIKFTKPRDEYDEPQPYIKVKVSYRFDPPRVFLVNKARKTRTRLAEDSVSTLDYIHDFERIDMSVSTSQWSNQALGTSGHSAYLQSLYATPVLDEIDQMYEEYADDGEEPVVNTSSEEVVPF